jgi:hypothetical protein
MIDSYRPGGYTDLTAVPEDLGSISASIRPACLQGSLRPLRARAGFFVVDSQLKTPAPVEGFPAFCHVDGEVSHHLTAYLINSIAVN